MTKYEGIKLHRDEKSLASITMGEVIRQTANNFPEPRFRPRIFHKTTHYTFAGIDPSPYQIWVTADGIGTKPELAERFYEESKILQSIDPFVFETLPFDTLAMSDGDESRWGRFMVGAVEVLDLNVADPKIISALAKGTKKACDEGRFALLNGETAELGYRTSGYGDTRLNWNAMGVSIIVKEKLILGENLKPGQPVVAFREESIRSNGLSKARAILETGLLIELGLKDKEEYIEKWLKKQGIDSNIKDFLFNLRDLFGHDPMEQVLLPWHKKYPETTRELLKPSRLYGPIMYNAQGGVEGERRVKMIAAAHVSGGGVPEKAKRMVEVKKLGVAINPIFPDPKGVSSLLNIAKSFPDEVREKLGVNERTACEQWNRGIGFMVVVEDNEEAKKLIEIAGNNNCEAGIAGEVIDSPEIQWRNNTWTY